MPKTDVAPQLVIRYIEQVSHSRKKLRMRDHLDLFWRNVMREMEYRKVTKTVLAARAKVSMKTLNNIERAKKAPQLDTLVRITNALGIEFWRQWVPDEIVRNLQFRHSDSRQDQQTAIEQRRNDPL